MREVKGYVFVVSLGHSEQIFGKRVSDSDGSFENLSTNNITPYRTKKDMRSGARKFEKMMRDVRKIRFGNLEMQIAESVQELEYFRNKDSLIVIASFEREKDFFGKVVEGMGHRSALPGMRLIENGFQPFFSIQGISAYERAEYAVREINRQAKSPATIATFNLQFIQ